MNQPSFDQIVELFTSYGRDLSEIRQTLGMLTDKVNFLVNESIAHNQPSLFSRDKIKTIQRFTDFYSNYQQQRSRTTRLSAMEVHQSRGKHCLKS